MKSVAIIPARGGSKRIPKKNIRLFHGKPIIAYSIETALKSGLFESVVVSTDSEEIAEAARGYGAKTPFMRDKDLADDYTGTDDVVLNALERLAASGNKYEYVCCIYATAPFLSPDDLCSGYDIVNSGKALACMSVATFSYPVFRALKLNQQSKLEMIWPEYQNVRSQDVSLAFHDAGQFYWARVQSFREDPSVFYKDAMPLILPRHRVHDIDTEEDWYIAEKFYGFTNN